MVTPDSSCLKAPVHAFKAMNARIKRVSLVFISFVLFEFQIIKNTDRLFRNIRSELQIDGMLALHP